MMKSEFIERIGSEISDKDYSIVEKVYTWHPAISETDGKEQISILYKTGGMVLINNMLKAAEMMEKLESEKQQIRVKLDKINERIRLVKEGDFSEEECREDANELFGSSRDVKEWEMAKSFLQSKYGVEKANEIAKEVEK